MGSVHSDSVLATLWVNSISSGSLTVSVYTLTDSGKEILLFEFPILTAASTNLIMKKSGVSLQRFRVEATYSGVCSYEVYVRSIVGAVDPLIVTPGQSYAGSNQSYSVAADIDMVSSGADNHLLLFTNPAGSNHKILIAKLSAGVAANNASGIFRLFSNPTVTDIGTNNTVIAVRNLNNGQPASIALVTTLPAVSNHGAALEYLLVGQNSGSSDITSDYSIVLQPGSSLFITGHPNGANKIASLTLVWVELPV
jgi:hypothetical protein